MLHLSLVCPRCGQETGVDAMRLHNHPKVNVAVLRREGDATPLTELHTTLCASCERDDLLHKQETTYVYRHPKQSKTEPISGTVDVSIFEKGSYYLQIPSKQKIGGVLLADDKPAFFHAYCACGQVSPLFKITKREDGVYCIVLDMDNNPLADCSKTEWVCPQCFSNRKW